MCQSLFSNSDVAASAILLVISNASLTDQVTSHYDLCHSTRITMFHCRNVCSHLQHFTDFIQYVSLAWYMYAVCMTVLSSLYNKPKLTWIDLTLGARTFFTMAAHRRAFESNFLVSTLSATLSCSHMIPSWRDSLEQQGCWSQVARASHFEICFLIHYSISWCFSLLNCWVCPQWMFCCSSLWKSLKL